MMRDARMSDLPPTNGPSPTVGGSESSPDAAGGLRILVVSPSIAYPPTWGFVKRVYHLVEQLAAEHQVTLLSYVLDGTSPDSLVECADLVHELVTVPRAEPAVPRRRLQQLSSLRSRLPFHVVKLRDPALQQAMDEILARERFDVVQIESSQLGWLRLPDGIPLVIDEHNIESELLGRMGAAESTAGRRWFNRWEQRRYLRFERVLWRSAAACAATSQRDANAIQAVCPDLHVCVVPNAVDTDEFRATGTAVKPDSMVFTGLLEYRPNEDGIRWFIKEILPRVREARPQAHLTVVGRGPDALLDSLRGPGVTITGWVPDVKPFVDEAAVTVVPLRMGGGTRLKVVEAMSMSSAVVSTTLGAEGIDVVSGQHLELADTPGSFARSVVALLEDADRRSSMGEAARQLIEERYSWTRSAKALEGLHRAVVSAMRLDGGSSTCGVGTRGVEASL